MRKRETTLQLSPGAELVKYLLVGVGAALILCIVFSLAAALALTLADLPQKAILPISMAIIGISAFIGSFIAGKMLHKKGLVLGILVGALLFALIFIGGLFIPDESLGSTVIGKLLLCIIPSLLGAVLGVNTRAKY